MIDPKSELFCDCHWHDFCFVSVFVLFKETSKEQYYPNIFVLLSVSILREIVLHDLMAPGGNPVEKAILGFSSYKIFAIG